MHKTKRRRTKGEKEKETPEMHCGILCPTYS
jgi:hypothetical protein